MVEVWDSAGLADALTQASPAIRLHSGVYVGPFVAASPQTTIRSCPGEWATLEVSDRLQTPLTVKANDCVVEQIGLRNTSADRFDPAGSSNYRRATLIVLGRNVAVRNCLIFDGGSAVSWFEPASGGELYGNIITDYGYSAPDRGHGHGVYTNNNQASATKKIRHNVFANYLSTAIKTSTDGGFIWNYLVDGNTCFTPDNTDADGAGIQFYALQHRAGNLAWINNRVFVPGSPALISWYGGIAAHSDAAITGNFLVGSQGIAWSKTAFDRLTVIDNIVAGTTDKPLFAEPFPAPLRTYRGNRFYGPAPLNSWPRNFMTGGKLVTPAQWSQITGDPSLYVNDLWQVPAGVWVEPNAYEAGRALITVHNIAFGPSVSASLDAVLADGDPWYLYSATNPEAGPISSGTYARGVPIEVPMTEAAAGSARTPAGLSPMPSMLPQFGAFVVRKVAAWGAV